MKPRMGYLVSQYPTVGHTFILREIRGLRSQGFDLLVISVKPADRAPQQLAPEEREEQSRTRVIRTTSPLRRAAIHARVFAERPWPYLRGLADALRMAGWSPRGLAAHLRYFGEAVVAGCWFQRAGHTHVHSHFSSTVAVLARQVFGFNLSLTLHGSDEFIDPAGFRLAEKVAAASLVCAISQFGRSQVMRFSDPKDWPKIVVLPLGVDPAIFSPAPFRAAPEVFEIAFVGQLAPVKGCFILLEAVERLVRGGRKLRLRFAGGGPLRGALAAEIEKRGLSAQARLEGPLNPPAVVALYRETDIFTIASFAEGVPVVLMEAMAMQIPCVATRITGIPELIRDGVDGLLVTASSAEEMAAAIARLMDDPDLRKRLGESARRQVMERYDLNRNTAAQAEVFRRYLAGAGFGPPMGSNSEERPVDALGAGDREANLAVAGAAQQAQMSGGPESVEPTPASIMRRYRECRKWRLVPKEFVYRHLIAAGIQDKRVLDFGCGAGEVATRLAMLGARVTGFDVLPGLIAMARGRAALDGYASRCEFVVAAGPHAALPPGSFDFVVCNAVLHHVDLSATIPALSDCLKPGGSMFLVEPIGFSPALQRLRDLTPVSKMDLDPGERQLSREDIDYIRSAIDVSTVAYFRLFERLSRVVPALSLPLLYLDRLLLSMFPILSKYAGIIVIIGKKKGQVEPGSAL